MVLPRRSVLAVVALVQLAIITPLAGGVDLLTIGAQPVQKKLAAGAYYRFKIDIINDYCAKPHVVARKLCMGTPQAVVSLKGCRGEAWLLANPSKPGEPTLSSRQYISKRGNETNFVEGAMFPITMATTHLAVYNPSPAAGYSGEITFQIWVVNTEDSEGKIKEIKPVLRPSDQYFQTGRLTSKIIFSGSIFEPSKIVISFYHAKILNATGSATTEPLEYRLYYRRLGGTDVPASATKLAGSIMSSGCGVLMNGLPVGNWTKYSTSEMNSTHTLHIDGGRYMFNVLARAAGWDNWPPPPPPPTPGQPPPPPMTCVDPCLLGSYEPLPYLWNPYKPMAGTDSKEFGLALTVLLSTFAVIGFVIVAGFLYIFNKAAKRDEAQELIEIQNARRAAIERGEKYRTEKKKRKLTCWERLTGEIVTKEDEDYDDCLTPEERQKIELFSRNELGADSELDTRDIPNI